MQDGYSTLHYASQNGHVECVNILIAHESDVNVKNKVCLFQILFICSLAIHLSIMLL